MTAVPMWARYMYEATAGQTLAEIPWEVPAGVKPNDRGDNKGHRAEDEGDEGGEPVRARGIGDGLPGETGSKPPKD